MPKEKINIMISGLPGKMASKVAEKILEQEDMTLPHTHLTGDIKESQTEIKNYSFCLEKPENHDDCLRTVYRKNLIIVDFTQPDAVNRNAELYCKHKIPFVMGTTGGDKKALEERVKTSEISAVIAPNMAKQIVAFQALMEDYSKKDEGSLKNCSLDITESHQQGKADTSGTAKAMVKYFNNLGIPFAEDKIEMIREPKKQGKIGIPTEYLSGHGWHRYIISSKQGNENITKLALGLKDFLLTDDVFSNYNCFSRRPQTEGNWIIWNRSPIEEIIIDNNMIDETYRISKDRTVGFSLEWFSNKLIVFNHNVNGRDIYASGTLDAIRYLDKKLKEGSKGQVYSMIDVLREK